MISPCPLRRRHNWEEDGDKRNVQGGKDVSGDLRIQIARMLTVTSLGHSLLYLLHYNCHPIHHHHHKTIIMRPTRNTEGEPGVSVQMTPGSG